MAHDVIPVAFVGRDSEIQRIAGLARTAAAGHGAAVFVEGEPGIGKTTLLDAVALEADDAGLRVHRTAAEDLEQRLPFAAMSNCLGVKAAAPDPELARLAQLLSGVDTAPAPSKKDAAPVSAKIAQGAVNREFIVAEAMLDVIDEWCAAGPVALIIDDLQWADPSSLLVLHRLGQVVGELPLLLVLAARSGPRPKDLGGLLRSLTARGAETITLGPLPETAVTALVERLVGAPPGQELRGLLTDAGGNPLYVSEMVAALSGEEAVGVTEGFAEVLKPDPWRGQVPRSLTETILRRLDFLPGKTRETLQMAAVLGPGVDVTELSEVFDVSVVALWELFSDAVAAGLLIERDEQLVFRHDLIRQVLAEQLPASMRTALHLRAGQVLASAGAPVERVAHYLVAGTTLDRHTLYWLIHSADALIVRAPELATRLFRRALAYPHIDEQTALVLRCDLARALLWYGRPAEAEQVIRAALAAVAGGAATGTKADRDREKSLEWMLTQACFAQGHVEDAVAVARAALRAGDLTPAEAGRFHGITALGLVGLDRLDEAAAAADEAIAIGKANGAAVAVGWGYFNRAWLRRAQGRLEEALALSDQVVAMFERGIQPEMQIDPYAVHGMTLMELDRFAQADQALKTAIRHNQRFGGAFLQLNHMARARLRFLDGNWDDALAEIHAGLDAPDPLGYAPSLRSMAALIAIHRDTHASDEAWSVPAAFPDTIGTRVLRHLGPWVRALALERHGHPDQALELLGDTRIRIADGLAQAYLACFLPDMARLAFTLGDRERAQEIADAAAAHAAPRRTANANGAAMLCRGLANHDPTLLLRAGEAYQRAGRPLYEGHAYENAAALLARKARVTEARKALDRAVQRYLRLDAGWDVARAEARLRQEGIRRGRQGPRKRPKHGWEALTGTESKVALLVAEGHSNPDIAARMYLSRRTVQSHVSSILAKLDIHSRVEIAVIAAQHR